MSIEIYDITSATRTVVSHWWFLSRGLGVNKGWPWYPFVTDLWSAAVHGGKQRRQVTIRIYTIFCWSKVCLCFYLCEATKDKIPLYPLSRNTRKESFRKILYNIAFEYSRFFSLIAAGNVSRSLTRFLTNLRHQYGIYGIADVSHVKRLLQRGASGNGCIRSRLCTT